MIEKEGSSYAIGHFCLLASIALVAQDTDDLLSRAINISIGVSDAGLGSAFGVSMRDDADIVDARVEEFRRIAKVYL